MRLRFTAEPPAALSQTEVREQAGIDASDVTTISNARVTSLISAAWRDAYSQCGLLMTDTSMEIRLDQFPHGVHGPSRLGLWNWITIPGGHVSAAAIFYTPSGAAEQSFAESGNWFRANSEPWGRLILEENKSWPSDTLRPADAVRVTATAGFGPLASDVPEILKRAMLMQIATWIEVTEDEGEALIPGGQILPSNRTSSEIYAQYSVKRMDQINIYSGMAAA